MIRPRTKPRRGQPTKAEKTAIRNQVYAESGGRCQIFHAFGVQSPKHLAGVLPSQGGLTERWHLVHIKGRRVHGWGRENLCGGCFWCHSDWLHRGGKPCPPKSPTPNDQLLKSLEAL